MTPFGRPRLALALRRSCQRTRPSRPSLPRCAAWRGRRSASRDREASCLPGAGWAEPGRPWKGAGVGAMRLVRGRLDSRARRVGAFAEAALALTGGLDPSTLGILAEAALELVPGEAALIYVPVPGGGLELVGAAGVDKKVLGRRRTTGAIAKAFRENQVMPLNAVDEIAIEVLGSTR